MQPHAVSTKPAARIHHVTVLPASNLSAACCRARRIDTLVDLVNLASIAYGYSIGGFDADKFVGDTLTLGVGREGEPYEGIGRGMLNIAGLPVYRDAVGGVGTPTSDNERTKMTLDTTHLVVLINGYDGNELRVADNARFIQELIRKYCQSDGGTVMLYR